MHFDTKTFELYHGETLAELIPFRTDETSYAFTDVNAANLHTFKWGAKSTASLDDFKVYTSAQPPELPVAKNVTITGKPNINQTLTATYTYVDPNEVDEGTSYCYWESSDTSDFQNTTRLTDDLAITAATGSSFDITSALSGKYLRFVVVPVNASGKAGDPRRVVLSNATTGLPYVIDGLQITAFKATEQQINSKMGFVNVLKWVAGKTYCMESISNTLYNTTVSDQKIYMVYAVYDADGGLEKVVTREHTVNANASTGIGIAGIVATATASKWPAPATQEEMNNITIKMFAFSSMTDVKPIQAPRFGTFVSRFYGSEELALTQEGWIPYD